MTRTPRSVTIVGASAAGWAVAEMLRDEGYDGRIALYGDESRRPYDRPPLSKRIVMSESDLRGIELADEGETERLGLDLHLGRAVTAASVARRTLTLADGEVAGWDALVIATGVSPRTLPGGGLTLRTAEDAIRLGTRLGPARTVLIVGAGILGGELAALAVTAGKRTIMIDPQAAPMADRFGPIVAGKLLALHAARGVETRFGVFVERVLDEPEGPCGVRLTDGSLIEADIVVVAVGCRPQTAWLEGSGVPLEDGVTCDRFCRALPDVYAAGDVANWFNPRYGRRMRIKHRLNATEQGRAVARNLLGAEEPFDAVPFFWTDQHHCRIQVHGLIGVDHETSPLDGALDPEAFLLGYSRSGLVEGVLGWNRAGQIRKARASIGRAVAETMA